MYIFAYGQQGLDKALDPRANGASLSKFMKLEVLDFILGGQRIDQKRKKRWQRG